MKLDDKYFKQDPFIDKKVPAHMIYEKRSEIPYILVIHHSTGNKYKNCSKYMVIDEFSDVGFHRGFEDNGITQTFHMKTERNIPSYAMAQYALHDTREGWELVPLVRYPLSDICWHAGDKHVNDVSFGIEVCGDYSMELLPAQGLNCIARIFKKYMLWLDYKTNIRLKIIGHKDVQSDTNCPGMIYDQLHALQTLIFT